VTVTHPLFPNVRRSPYFAETLAAGASAFMPYNHMYMPISYGRDPRDEYTALTTRVTLWDVGAERQTALTGRDAVRLADHLATRDLSAIEVGQCRFTLICDPEGLIMTEPIVIRPFADTVWISHGDVDLTLWARGLAISGGYDATVHEPDVAPMQLQGPRSVDVINAVTPDVDGLAFYRARETSIAGVPCIVTRTGWSREHGYEIYPLSSGNATRVWTALRDAGEEHDLMVIGPNLSRALEGAITDTHYYVNSGMNPYEAGQGRLVDLDHGPFVGQEALRAGRRAVPADGRILAGHRRTRSGHRSRPLGCVLLRPRTPGGDRPARRRPRTRRAHADSPPRRHGPGRGGRSSLCQLNRKRGDPIVTAEEAMVAICRCWDELDADALAALFTADGAYEDPLKPDTLRGIDDVREGNRPAMAALTECRVTLGHSLAQGDLGFAEGEFRSALAGGGRLDFPFALIVEMENGLVKRAAEYFDTKRLLG
jgi:glycine cleavage system aminomethyltransferase T/ketosteroid isomerase-like protein